MTKNTTKKTAKKTAAPRKPGPDLQAVEEIVEEQAPENVEVPQHVIFRRNRQMLRGLGFDLNLTYYISGPMSGYDDYNYPAFQEAAMVLRSAGLDVESPHENEWPEGHEDMEESALWDHMMGLCADQMDSCAGIILLKGWPQSRGATKELGDALNMGWPVWWYDNGQLINMNKGVQIDDNASEATD